jgi:hypothetical protein
MSEVDNLFQVYRSSVPPEVTATPLGEDIGYALAEMFNLAKQEVERLNAGANLGTSTGLFVDAHANDRGLRRQEDETDDQLIDRLRKPPLAGTVAAIIEAVDAIVGDGKTIIIELPRQSMYVSRHMGLNRGHRMGAGRGVVVVLIPASADALESVRDAVRSKIAAGKLYIVEEYVGVPG